MEKMCIAKWFSGALSLLVTYAVSAETCLDEGISSRGSLRGPSYVVLGESNEFSTSVSLSDLLDDPNVEFFTSEDFFVGSRDYSSLGSDAESKIDIVFDDLSSLGASWVKANEISNASPYVSEFCMDVNVQEHRPIINEIETVEFYSAGSGIHVTIDIDGTVDQHSQRGNNNQGPLYTVQYKCRNWRSWRTKAQNSASEVYELFGDCNLNVRVRAFDGSFFSEYEGKRFWYEDLEDPGEETGADSAACLAECPLSLEPYRSHCMQSHPVCHG